MKTQFLYLAFLLFCQSAFAQFGTIPQVITSSNLPNSVSNVSKFTTCDYNGDGRLDLVATSPAGATGFRGDGAGSFHAPDLLISEELPAIPPGFFGAQFADLDGDDLPDLAVGKTWRKNLGAGNFGPQQSVFEMLTAAILDIDGDLLQDVVSCDSMSIYWQKNLGSGLFDMPQILTAANNALIFKSIDFNADGLPDFLARQNEGCFWHKNLGGGAFEAVMLFSAVPDNLATADIDTDGQIELIYTTGSNIVWQEFDAAGVPTLLQTVSTKFKAGRGFALGDLNADNFPDILVGELTTGNSGSYFKFLPATGKFATSTTEPSPGFFPDYGLLEIADLDGDGRQDYCTVSANNYQMVWFRQISPGAFNSLNYLQAGLHIPKSIVSLDYDSDGDLDLVATGQEPSNSALSNSTVVVNLGNGAFDEKRGYPGGGTQNFSGDLDGDGLKDRAFYGNNDSIYWQKFLGNNLWGARKSLPGLLTSCKQVAGGDMDNDGDIDLFACNGTDAVSVNARFYWFENDGAGLFTPHLVETDIQLCSSAFPLDVNEDGLLDMVLYFFNSSPRVYTNLGGGNFSAPGNFFPPNTPSPSNLNQSLLTDLDADGRIDFVYITKNWGDQKIAWYRNLGPDGFSGEQTLASWSTNASWATNYFTVFDATGDGLPDIVISDNYWAKIRFIKGLGSGTFSAMSVIYNETQAFNYGNFFAITHFDVNGDGKLDIVFGKRSLMSALPNYLMWLANESPAPQAEIVIMNQSVICEDGGTPGYATDDVRVLKMQINNPTNPTGKYYLTNPQQTVPLDTFNYGQMAIYRWPPGSSGDGITRMKEIHDLQNPGVFKNIVAEDIGHCSVEVPGTIAVVQQSWSCDFNGTLNNPTDDRVVVIFKTSIQNPQQPSTKYYLTSNLGGLVGQNGAPITEGQYGFVVIGLLPPGSAGQPGQVVLTLTDQVDPNVVGTWSFDNPGVCSLSDTDESENPTDFQVFPNPVARGESLNLRLGAPFSGETQVEILSLEGRVLRTWFFEKTAAQQVENLTTDEALGASFMLRVSDGKRSGIQLVMSL